MNAELAQRDRVPVALQPRRAPPSSGIELADPVVITNAPDPAIFHPPDGARAARRTPGPGRRGELVGQPAQGRRRPAWPSAPRVDPSRFELTFVGRTPAAARRAGRSSAPLASEDLARPPARAWTATSRRASTTRARTRCSRRSRAACRRSSGEAAATRSSSARAASASTARRMPPPRSTASAAELDERRDAIVVPALAEVADALPRGASTRERAAAARPRAAPPAARRRRPAPDARLARPLSRLFVLGDDARLGARRRGRVRHRGRAARRLPRSAPPGVGAAQRGGRSSSTRATSPRSTRAGPARPTGSGSRTSTAARERPATRSSTARTRRSRRDPARFERVQVTHREIEELVARGRRRPGPGAPDPDRDRARRLPARRRRRGARRPGRAFGLPADAFVVGSFAEGRDGVGRRARAEGDQGPRRARRGARARRTASVADLVVLLTGPARGYVRAGLERPRRPSRPPAARRPRRARRRPTTRSTPTSIASRQEGGPKSILESMATGVPLVTTRAGQAPDLVVDGDNGLLVDVDDADGARGRAAPRRSDDAALAARFRAAGRVTAEENSHARARAALGGAPRGLRGAGRWHSARVARLRPRRRSRWARLLAERPRRRPGCGSSTAGTRSRRRASRSRAARPSCRSSPRGGRTAPRTSRSSTSGRRYLPRDLRPLLWLARRRRAPGRRQPGRRRVPGLGGRPHGRAQRAAPPRRARRPTTSSTRARSASAPPTTFLGEPRGAWEILPNAVDVDRFTPGPVPAGRARSCSSAATRRRRTGSSSRSRRSAACCDEHPDARLLVARPARLGPGADRSRGSGSADASSSSAATAQADGARRLPPRARPPPHEGERPVPDRRDRGDGLRRSPSRTPRAAARSSSSATRRASASRIPTASSATSRPRPRRSRRPSSTVLADRDALRGAGARAGGRAVRAHRLARPPRGDLRRRS